ncbi:MAG TPA: patatin-like phospholipase family protein [Actinomycetota bacterium]|nr:patatin-like phospholipase family protein [Actinomycetota bacterium]
MKTALVLGGGGIVGMAYHAGALKALADAGARPEAADVLVGTSAGSVMSAYLAAGWTAGDFYDYAHGRHPSAAGDEGAERDEVRRLFTPLAHTRGERVRRSIGSMFAAVSARTGLPARVVGGVPPALLRRAFPAGMYSTEETRDRLRSELPRQWPERDVFVCAADLYTGARVAFGAPGAPDVSFPDAVLASCAIPGVFPPVSLAGRFYVDGGVVSATSLDLAVEAGCDAIVCIAPLGYRHEDGVTLRDPKLWGPVLVRTPWARALRREVRAARARGVEVLVVRPWISDLVAHGTNSMRQLDRRALSDGARRGTARLLEAYRDHPALEALRAPSYEGRTG